MEWQPGSRGGLSRGTIGRVVKGEEFCCALCRGKGTLPSVKGRCPACGGKGVVTTGQYTEAISKAGSQIQREAEPSPISLCQVPLPAQAREGEAARRAAYVGQPQRGKGTRTVSLGVVHGLVRRLMATERARILRRKGIDLDRYALEKRSQRWRESKKPIR